MNVLRPLEHATGSRFPRLAVRFFRVFDSAASYVTLAF